MLLARNGAVRNKRERGLIALTRGQLNSNGHIQPVCEPCDSEIHCMCKVFLNWRQISRCINIKHIQKLYSSLVFFCVEVHKL